jgi:hypothetical protein
MSETGENSAAASPSTSADNAPATPAAKKGRGRPPKSSAPETPQQRIDRLNAELQQAHEAKKIAEQHRDFIVGRVMVAHALANPDFRKQIAAILKTEVKGKGELAAISELLS